jgi:hypothetical protein
MANFPNIAPSESYTPALENFTFIADGYPSGVQLARAGRLYQVYACSMRYDNISYTSLQTLWDFHRSMRGRLTTFTFTDWAGWDATPTGIAWPKLYIGTTDGVTTGFDVPMKSSSSYTLYRAGSALTPVTDYSFGSGTGVDGRDKITLVSAGASGDLLEWVATGRAAFNVRFGSDKFPMTFMSNGVASCALDVIEAR